MLYLIFDSQGNVDQSSNHNNFLSTLHSAFKVIIKHAFFPLPLSSGVVLSPQRGAAADPSLRPGQSMTAGQGQAVSQGQYKCLELSDKDHQENRTGERPKSF